MLPLCRASANHDIDSLTDLQQTLEPSANMGLPELLVAFVA